MTNRDRTTLVILGTGGTIAGRASHANDNIGYTAAQLGVAQLLADVPGLRGLNLEAHQVAQLDSKDMSLALWQALLGQVAAALHRDEVQGVVITHGTDTLEETAYFLHLALAGSGLPAKPVVLTCAMRPASSQAPDGPQNLLDAVAVAQDPQARGVLVVCAGSVHSAVDVQKTHSYRLDAFGSGDAGVLGLVEEGCVRWVRVAVENQPIILANRAKLAIETIVNTPSWPRVEIVLNHAGADGHGVDLLLRERSRLLNEGGKAEFDGVEGLVVAGTGNGTVHVDLMAALTRAHAAGVVVLRCSRCANGSVIEASAPASGPLLSAGSLSPVKARIALMLSLLGRSV